MKGSFACAGVGFATLQDFYHQPKVASPNGRNFVELQKDGGFSVSADHRKVATLTFPGIDCCTEIVWSPNSTRFSIMYSDGGAMGGYHVHLFRISSGKVEESDLPHDVAINFGSRHRCLLGGQANLYFLAWAPDSRKALLVAEVPPESYCGKQTGRFAGYLVDAATGDILHHYGEKQTSLIEKACRASGRLALPGFPPASVAPIRVRTGRPR